LDYAHSYTFIGRRPDLHIDLTDTHGGPVTPDITQRQDIDKIVTVGVRNDLRGNFAVDTWGREGAFPYVAEEANRLLTVDDEGVDFSGAKVQLDINGAPRDGSNENGHHFLATRLGKLWLVGPPACFRNIVDEIRGPIYRVIGFSPDQQFRSSAAGKASRKRKRLKEDPEARDWIPDRKSGVHIANVDRFGNVRLGNGTGSSVSDYESLAETDEHQRRLIQIQVGGNSPETIELGTHLSLKQIGALTKSRTSELLLPVLYLDPNRGDRPTIATPWIEGESEIDRVRRSAFYHISGVKPDNPNPDPDSFVQEDSDVTFSRAEAKVMA